MTATCMQRVLTEKGWARRRRPHVVDRTKAGYVACSECGVEVYIGGEPRRNEHDANRAERLR